MPDLWVPGFAGPLDDLVGRIHRQIEAFAREQKVEQAFVEVELFDGVRWTVASIAPEPGYGFITLTLHKEEEDAPVEAIVPIGSVKRIELRRAEEQRGNLGFTVPAA